MANTKKKTEKQTPKLEDVRPMDRVISAQGTPEFAAIRNKLEASTYSGAAASAVFTNEILTQVDEKVLRPALPTQDSAQKKLEEWIKSDQFDAAKVKDKLEEFEGQDSVGGTKQCRLFSARWARKIRGYEGKTGKSLYFPIIELWMLFAHRFDETARTLKIGKNTYDIPAGMSKADFIEGLLTKNRDNQEGTK